MRERGSAARRVFLSLSLSGLVATALFGGVALLANNLTSVAAVAPAAPGTVLGKSGLPVPRFVSLKAGKVNVRVGPGDDYKVAWTFTRKQLPVEIIAEFENWRRIRDSDGQVGWVFHSLLTGLRTAVVTPWGGDEPRALRSRANRDAGVTAYLQPGVLASIDRCRANWCDLSGKGFSGWIQQDQLWGVYPNEEID
jgi:SH3-like domain-containing protein